MGLREMVLGVCVTAFGAVCAAQAAEQPAMPALAKVVALHKGVLEVEAGGRWETHAAVPELAADERPVLALQAYAQAGGGCNYVLQLLVDGAPVTESFLRRRLINKRPWFDPPGTKYHFSWYGARQQLWMTVFGGPEPANWAGTGRDYAFVFDLTGLLDGGKRVRIGVRHGMPGLPAAIKKDRAPLVVTDLRLGALKQADIARLRRNVEASDAMKPAPVRADLPADAKPGERPYELVWSGRKESPRAQVAFEDLRGWTVGVSSDMKVSMEASVARRLWRPRLARLSYSGGSTTTTILVRPPAPIEIAGPFDAADLWVYADIDRRHEQPQVVAYLEDSRGRDYAIDLGRVKNSYWNLQHGVLGRLALARAEFPMRFVALSVHTRPPKKGGVLHLESLAFHQRNRKPFTRNTRPAKPAFPTSADGLLPTAPAGATTSARAADRGAVFACKTHAGVLRFRIAPEKGVLAGVSARWNDGPWFQPMAGGRLNLDMAAPAEPAKVVSAKLDGDRLVVRWRRGVEWRATYQLRACTLVVDVACDGGAAEGLSVGRVAGLPKARALEVPYLCYGYGYGPHVACSPDVFVSVLADWHHCRASVVNGFVPKTTDEGVGLMTGTEYRPLTDGRRNDLRDRLLVTVSPEFADVLPNIPNPATPHLKRLSPYMFVMSSYMRPNLWRTMKRHGIDHVITCDFARFYVDTFPEGFAGRWRPHPSLTMQQIQQYRKQIKDLGYLFGAYSDLRDWFPLNWLWDKNCVSLNPDGDLTDGWYGNFRTKPNFLPEFARLVGEKAHEHYPPDSVYMDTHTCVGLIACDYEAGVPGAGVARDQVYFNGDCILETRKWYGSTMSEGRVRWMYAGVADMDYASLFSRQATPEIPPLVDFDLLKIHPLNLGTMMGYGPSIFFGRQNRAELGRLYRDTGSGPAPIEFHHYVSASVAYGHMLMIGYSYLPPLSRMVHLYAMMQGLQREYLTDTAASIRYHDGRGFVSTSQALRDGALERGRVWVRYSGGLDVFVNYNAKEDWTLPAAKGRDAYTLPPYGWLAVKPGKILSFSALLDGKRVDYAECPEYRYLRSDAGPASVGGLSVHGAVWLKRETASWRLVPCADLGAWERVPAEGYPAHMQDMRLKDTPADRGCRLIAVDTLALMGKAPVDVRVQARDASGKAAKANVQAAKRLRITPEAHAVDYLLH